MKTSKIIAIASSAVVAITAIVLAVVFLTPSECKHDSTEWRTATEATCTAEGARNSVCKDCGTILKTENIDKLAHKEVIDAAKAPTCAATGLTEGKHCSVCGTVTVAQKPVDKTAHTYDGASDADCNVCGETRVVACTHAETEAIPAKAATCTETGLTEGAKCKKCGEIIVAQETLPIVAHTYDNKFDADCNVCGHKRDAECGHFETEIIPGKAASCTASGLTEGKKCKKCGEITVAQATIPKAAHTEVKIPAVAATCTKTGLTEGKKCSVCGTVTVAQQETPKAAHNEVIIPAVAATCTKTGLTEGKKCSVCGTVTVAQQTTAKIAHTYDDKYDESCNKCGYVRDAECGHFETETIPGKAATCTETGLIDGERCKKCGEILVAQTVINMKPHAEVIDAAVEATCTATGLTEGKHCSVCDTVLVAQTVVDMKPHTEVIDAAVEATCTQTGLTQGKHCSVCNTVTVVQETIPEKGHDYFEDVIDPTCTEKGYTLHECTVCHNFYEDNYIETVAHSFVDKYCTYCGKEEFGEINYDTSWYASSSNSFIITTREQLSGLSYLVYKGNGFSGKTVSLGSDIDLADAEWIPIGTTSTAFSGTFDGKSFTISNVRVTEQISYIGLFGKVSGTLKNFTVSGAHIATEETGSYVAIACGYTTGTMSAISVSGSVEAEKCSYVGGIAGRVNKGGSASYTKLTNLGDVSGTSYVGGIFGELYNSTESSQYNYVVTISECSNNGKISGTDYVGGLFGRIYANNSWPYAGGNNTKITANLLENSGDVSGNNLVGGIAGCMYSDASSTMKDCTNSGQVTGASNVADLVGKKTNITIS